jgi:hypothetical protein
LAVRLADQWQSFFLIISGQLGNPSSTLLAIITASQEADAALILVSFLAATLGSDNPGFPIFCVCQVSTREDSGNEIRKNEIHDQLKSCYNKK